MSVTVITPTIPGRVDLLRRAFLSVKAQTAPVALEMMNDETGLGPAVVRNHLMRRARTGWVAFLDDDDELYPDHIASLLAVAEDTGADVVYPDFDLVVDGEVRPSSDLVGDLTWNPDRLRGGNFIPVTVLARREAILDVGGFPQPGTPSWPIHDCEDWGLWLRLLDAGATFAHLPMVTWAYHKHGGNTAGRPDNVPRPTAGHR